MNSHTRRGRGPSHCRTSRHDGGKDKHVSLLHVHIRVFDICMYLTVISP